MVAPQGNSQSEWRQPTKRSLSDSVETLFRRHNDNLVRFLRTKLGCEAEASEAAQEAYLRLLALKDVDQLVSPRAYLYRIAQNVVHDMRRRGKVRAQWQISEIPIEAEPASQDRHIMASESLAAIRVALLTLSPPCREAFRLSRDEGLGAREIAGIIGVGERMVRNYIATALRTMHEAIDDEEIRP